jgi:tetratricopeptide (TPR) repeat protein
VNSRPQRWREAGLALLLVAGTFLIYIPVWQAGFIWDDDSHLTNNPCIVGPLGFKEIWTSGEAIYYPLVLTTFWIQHALWGLQPMPYHLVNVAFHAVCGLLLWESLRRLGVKAAWLGAALWTWHPVQVESVAWITELKNTQSGLFYLLAIMCFITWRRLAAAADPNKGSGSRRPLQHAELAYAGTLICATLAILSKSSTVTLPVVLGLCWWWIDGEWRWKNVLRLLPLGVISAVASAWTIWEQRFHSMAIGPQWQQTWPERFIIAGKVICFYLGKLAWPGSLSFIYPRWEIHAQNVLAYIPFLGAAALLLLFWRFRTLWGKAPFFAFAYFVLSLFPVLGFFTVYFFRYSFVGDHFQYLAGMGPLALAAACGVKVLPRQIVLPLGGAVLFALGLLGSRHAADFRDDERLWRATLEQNPNSAIARNNLGELFFQRGEIAAAEAEYHRGLEANPDFPELHNNLGNALARKGKVDEAIVHYRQAAASGLNYAEPHCNLAKLFLDKGDVNQAVAESNAGIQANPIRAEGHYNLGNALLRKGELEAAIAAFERALQLAPNFSEAENNLANALLAKGEPGPAELHLRKAIASNQGNLEAHRNLAALLLQTGHVDEAIKEYQFAVLLMPGEAALRFNLATAFLMKGRADDAISQYEQGLKTNPLDIPAHNNLGSALLYKGRAQEAITNFNKVLELQPESATARLNLGLALLQTGDKQAARTQFKDAQRINPSLVLPEPALKALREKD